MRSPLLISKARLFIVAALPFFWSVDAVLAGPTMETINSEVPSLYAKSRDAIVKVHAEMPSTYNLPSIDPHRVGTGFFIDAEGRLITFATLVDGAEKFYIDWRGRHVEAKLISRDPVSRLALLKVDPAQCVDKGETLPALTFGDSDELQVGSMVVAVGFPYDLPSVPVLGSVAGFDLSCGEHVFPLSFIRADCRLSPGQGGAPLLNVHGEVVGLILAARGKDHCYALPGNAARKVCSDIVAHGEPQYGWVGLDITQRQLTNSLFAVPEMQVYIREVFSNTPAATAGFRDRDVLIRIQTNEIHQVEDVLNRMFYRRSGESVPIAVVRAGVTQELTVVIGQRPLQVEQPVVQQAPPPSLRNPPGNIGPLIVPTAASK